MGELITDLTGLNFPGLYQTNERCSIHNEPLLGFADKKACPICQKERLEQKENEYRETMTYKHTKRITYDRLAKDSLISDATIKVATFDNYVPKNQESADNLAKAQRIAQNYLGGQVFNTLLSGTAGAGKSHLAKGIAYEVNEKANPWRSVLFLSIDEWLLWIRSTYSDNNLSTDDEKSILDKTAKNDLLVLDDLGAETGFIGTKKTASDFTQRMLYGLMNRRQEKSTIITTNLNSSQISGMYDQKVISRLYRGLNENSLIKFEKTKDHRIKF